MRGGGGAGRVWGGGQDGRMEACKSWQHKDWHGEKETELAVVHRIWWELCTHNPLSTVCVMPFFFHIYIDEHCYLHAGLEQQNDRSTWAEYKSTGRKDESFKCRGGLPVSVLATKHTKPLTLPLLTRGSVHSAQTIKPLCWEEKTWAREGLRLWLKLTVKIAWRSLSWCVVQECIKVCGSVPFLAGQLKTHLYWQLEKEIEISKYFQDVIGCILDPIFSNQFWYTLKEKTRWFFLILDRAGRLWPKS